MRICHLIDTLVMGGAEKVAALHARELAQRGHIVTLLAYHPSNGNSAADLIPEGLVRVIEVGGARADRFARMRRVFRGEPFDVVHAYKLRSAIWGGAATLGLRRPAWFIGQHYLDSDPWGVRALGYALFGSRISWVVPSSAAAAARRSFGSDAASISLIPNPVDVEVFTRRRPGDSARMDLGLDPQTPVVSIVANLHSWKNHSMFLRVAQRILEKQSSAVFIVIGEDRSEGTVQAQCTAMGLDHAVRFLGRRDDVPRLLEATDVLVVTSPEESFCLALAEAGAMGVPSVSTDNGGASDVLIDGETGFIVPKDDDQVMSEAILRLLNDKPLRKGMGDAARKRVRNTYALASVVDQLEALYLTAV